jgi:hypothetical protein
MVKASLATLAHMGCLVEENWGTLSGLVSNIETNNPIDGAQVLLYNPIWGYTFQTTTAEDGSFSISALAGEHILEADARHFAASVPFTITILPGESTHQEISLRSTQEQTSFLPIARQRTLAPLPGCP